MEKFKKIASRFTFRGKWENRLRRVFEISLMITGFLLVLAGLKDMLCLGAGIICMYTAYRGMIEDLPKYGVLNKRRFWE